MSTSPPRSTGYVGIDPGSTLFYGVAIDPSLRVLDVKTFSAGSPSDLTAWAAPAEEIAIDAPQMLSSAPHRDDPMLAPKFRTARCAEIQLGRELRIWVPWATPMDASSLDPWMRIGIELFHALAEDGHTPIEVFPYAGFRVLAGMQPLPKKRTAAGRAARVALLESTGVRQQGLSGWRHDAIDALLAAVVAYRKATGTGRGITCGHDGSAIWMP